MNQEETIKRLEAAIKKAQPRAGYQHRGARMAGARAYYISDGDQPAGDRTR